MISSTPDLEVILRCFVALAAGAIIGAERRRGNKLAGIKTHALVCVGAALFTILGIEFGGGTEGARVVGQIASGIGFLGAGAILRDGTTVKGLTSAANIWCVAAIGCLAGAGLLRLVLIGSVTILVCLLALKHVSNTMFPEAEDVEEESKEAD